MVEPVVQVPAVPRVGRADAIRQSIQEIKLPGRDHARGAVVLEGNVIHQWGIRQIRIDRLVRTIPRFGHPPGTVEAPSMVES